MQAETAEMRNKITVSPQEALDYHEYPTPGKIGIAITVPTETARDLSLAYTPGTLIKDLKTNLQEVHSILMRLEP